MKKILTVSLLALCGGLVAAGAGTKMSKPVTTVKAEENQLSYIEKTLTQYDLQLNNNGDNRLQLSILVPAGSGLDFAEGQDIRYSYNTDDGADASHENCHILQLAAEGETAATIKARTYLLNMFRGMILLDGEPLVDTKGSGTDVIRLWEYAESNHGRIILTRNADGGTVGKSNRLKISMDVCLPGFPADGGEHTITFKRGLELPSMSYALNKDLGTTSKTTVYKTTNDITFKFTSAASMTPTCVMSDESKEDIKVADVGFGQLSSYSAKVADGRFGFHFGLVAPEAKKGTTYYPNTNQYNVHTDPNNGSFNKSDGALANLKTWDYIEYNADPLGSGSWVSAKTVMTDSRLYSSGHKNFDSYNDFWFDLRLGTSAPETVGIRLNKGMKIPTQLMIKSASDGDHTKNSYVVVNGTYTFTYAKQSDGQYLQTAITGQNELDLSSYCVETAVTGMKLYTGANNWCYAAFALTEYDGTKKNFCYNNQYFSVSGEFNGPSKITTDKGGFIAKTPSSSEVATRLYRVYVNEKECGFPINYKAGGQDFTTVTVPAGTRFPALSYVAENIDNADSVAGSTKKFYETKTDVTLIKVANNEYKEIGAVRNAAIEELTSYYDIDAYRDAEKAIINTAVPKVTDAINTATTYEAIQQIVADTKQDIDSLKTDAQYTAEELAEAIAQAKTALETYLDVSLYTYTANSTYKTALSNAKKKIDAVKVIDDLPAAIEAAHALLDAVPSDAAIDTARLEACNQIDAELAKYNAEDYTVNYAAMQNLAESYKAQINKTVVISGMGSIAGLVTQFKSQLQTVETDAQLVQGLNSMIPTLPDPAEFDYDSMSSSVYNKILNCWNIYCALSDTLKAQIEGIDKVDSLVLQIYVYELMNYYWRNSSGSYFGVQTLFEQVYPMFSNEVLADFNNAYLAIATYVSETTSAADFDQTVVGQLATEFYNAYVAVMTSTTADYIENEVLAVALKEDALSSEDAALIKDFVAKIAFEQELIDELLANIPGWNGYETLEEMMAGLNVTMEDIENFYGPLSVESFYGEEAIAYLESILPVINVMDLIDAIGTVELTDASKAKIDAARAAYEELTELEDKVGNLDVLLAAEQAYQDLVDAEALATAKTAALQELTNYFNIEDYRAEEKALLEEGIVTVTARINAATSIEEVNRIVASTKADIDSLKTAAEYEAEELAAAQVAAKAELEEYAAAKDASKYDEAGNAAIAKAVADGKSAIDEATSIEAVNTALEAAKAAIDAVEEYVAPTKKGCGSSVVAASAIITLVSLLGAGLISTKRKHD